MSDVSQPWAGRCNPLGIETGAVPNPNGIPSLSPGLRAGRYPGSTFQTRPNPFIGIERALCNAGHNQSRDAEIGSLSPSTGRGVGRRSALNHAKFVGSITSHPHSLSPLRRERLDTAPYLRLDASTTLTL